jgi:hypothetical protein
LKETLWITLIIIASIIFTFGLTLYLSRKYKVDKPLPYPENFNEEFEKANWYKKLNFGALVFTNIWLVINGFWLSAVLYFVLFLTFPPIAILISIVLFFKGTSLSWDTGERWGNNCEAFLDEQAFWNALSFFPIGGGILLLISMVFSA